MGICTGAPTINLTIGFVFLNLFDVNAPLLPVDANDFAFVSLVVS